MFDRGLNDSDSDSSFSDDSSEEAARNEEEREEETGRTEEEGLDKDESLESEERQDKELENEGKDKSLSAEGMQDTGLNIEEKHDVGLINSEEKQEDLPKGNEIQGAENTKDAVDSKPSSFRVVERVTDENKPTHTYWELLDDDEKTNMEISEFTKEEAIKKIQEQEEELRRQQQELLRQQVKETAINMNNNKITKNLWHELHQNDFDEETFL